MPNADLKFVPGRLPDGYAAVPVTMEQREAPLQICVVIRPDPDAVGGALVVLRDHIDAVVYLGCVTDTGGTVQEWLELWVQDVDRLAEAPPSAREALTNAVLDDRWDRTCAALQGGERPLTIQTGMEKGAGAPTWIDRKSKVPVHPKDRESGACWKMCTDDAILEKAGLPPYSRTLHRYLFLPELGAESPFVAITAGAPSSDALRPLTSVVAGGNLIAFNAGGGRLLVRRYSPVGYEALVDLYGGGSWKGITHGREMLDLELSTRSNGAGRADELTEGGLFLGPQGKLGRLLEAFHLKLRAFSDAIDSVRSLTQAAQRPLLNVSSQSFQVRMDQPARGLPYLWTARVTLADPGDAVALPIQATDAKYYAPGRSSGPSVYLPQIASGGTRGRGTVRIREVLTERGEETVLEATLATGERIEASKNDLVWIRLNLRDQRVDLYARLDAKSAMAAGEWRLRTVPRRMDSATLEQVTAAKGVPIPESGFEHIPLMSSPVDLYSLGVLGVRTLLVNPGTSLPVALDEVLSLARAAAADSDGKSLLSERIGRLFDRDPRWLESLGPQRLIHEEAEAKLVLEMVPATLWWETLALLARMFPGVGPESWCADLGDARQGGLHMVYEGVRGELDRLLIRTRSLLVIDWRFNREIHAVLRDSVMKHAGAGRP